MKFRVTMKDPDTLHDALAEAVAEEVAALSNDAEEREAIATIRREKASEVCAKWFEYGEYLTVEIDTAAHTCTVVPK
jgi:hypothetical protein